MPMLKKTPPLVNTLFPIITQTAILNQNQQAFFVNYNLTGAFTGRP